MTSVAFDWLSSGKPLVMVQPHEPEAEVLAGGLLDRCPAVDSMSGESVVDLIDEAISRCGLVSELAQFYLGDTAAGEQTSRFIQSSEHVIRNRSEERRLKHAQRAV